MLYQPRAVMAVLPVHIIDSTTEPSVFLVSGNLWSTEAGLTLRLSICFNAETHHGRGRFTEIEIRAMITSPDAFAERKPASQGQHCHFLAQKSATAVSSRRQRSADGDHPVGLLMIIRGCIVISFHINKLFTSCCICLSPERGFQFF